MVTRRDWWIGVGAVLLATLLLGWLAGFGVDAQSGGLFIEVDPALALVDPSPGPGVTTIRGRLVRIDFQTVGELSPEELSVAGLLGRTGDT